MSALSSQAIEPPRKPQQRRRRIGAAALLDQFPVDAFRQDASHMRRRPQVGTMHRTGENAIQIPMPARVFPQERGCKVFQRPREQRVLHALEHELRFHVRKRHRFLRDGVRF